MERLDEMTPEEAGRAMGEFLKGMEKGVGKRQKGAFLQRSQDVP